MKHVNIFLDTVLIDISLIKHNAKIGSQIAIELAKINKSRKNNLQQEIPNKNASFKGDEIKKNTSSTGRLVS